MPVQIGAKTHNFTDPTGLLSDCHRRVEMFLGTLEAVANVIDRPATEETRRALESALRYFAQAAPKHRQKLMRYWMASKFWLVGPRALPTPAGQAAYAWPSTFWGTIYFASASKVTSNCAPVLNATGWPSTPVNLFSIRISRKRSSAAGISISTFSTWPG
jgi:hypothetical protein